MPRILRSLAVKFGLALLASVSSTPAFAVTSAAPRHTIESTVSALPDATIALEPFSETERFRSWAIAVTAGTASVDALEVDDSGSSFDVTVLGESATVEMTLTIAADFAVSASCFDFDKQAEIGRVESRRRVVIDVVPEGLYECRYQTDRVRPSPGGGVPPTDTISEPRTEPPPPWASVLAIVAGLITGTLLIGGGRNRGR